MASAGEAKILAMSLARDGGAGIEQTSYHGGVDLRHISFKRGGAIHHRYASNAYVILYGYSLAFELAGCGTGNISLPVPSVILVFITRRLIAGRSRVSDLRQSFI